MAITAEARSIKGQVLNATDSTALAGAVCRLSADTQPILSTSTDSDGNFHFDIDIQSKIDISIEKEGFSPIYITLKNGKRGTKLNRLYMEKSHKLKEVTVTANSAIIKDGITIVYPSSTEVKASATAVSLFQKLPLPGLLSDQVNRTLSVDGGSPMILINGVPSSMTDVNSILPKDIMNVKYSRITPARYAGRGVSGLLDISVRKLTDGGQIYVWGQSAVNTTFMDAQLRTSYHHGSSQFTLSYSPSWRNYKKVYDHYYESFIGNNFRVDLEASDQAPFYYHTHDIRLRYDWIPIYKTLFSASFNIKPYINSSNTDSHNIDSTRGIYDNRDETLNKELSPSLDLFLRHDINKKNSLEAQIVGTLGKSNYSHNNTYIYPDGYTESFLMDVDSRRRSLITEVSYVHSISNFTSLSGGIQNTVSRSANTYLNSDYNSILTENNNYVYVRFSRRIKSVYISASSGAKLIWIKNDLVHRHFIRNISTAQFSWNIDSKWNIQGVFQHTPSIPSLSLLTDYPQQITPYLLYNGNPDLKVADNFIYKIMGTFNIRKFSASFQTALSDTRNCVINDISYLGDGLFLSHSVNSRKALNFYNTVTFQLRNIHGFGATLFANISHYTTAGENWEHSLTSLSGSISLWWNKGPLTLSYWCKLPGKYLSGHSIGKEENGDVLQVDFKPNRHWTLGVEWMYMFNRHGTEYPVWNYSQVNPAYRDRYIMNNANMIVFSVSYNTDFGSIFHTVRRNLNNTDNTSSILKM
ncbi:MAG: TonB-dependent receptor family protein [Muribaculaceae bacterium]|nr:TonB-dependent receptor family protein [Muribaculaceae bacterium]